MTPTSSLCLSTEDNVKVRRSNLKFIKVTVLATPENQGYGGNQKLGYAYAIRNDFDFVVLLHGDGQYAPEKIPDLLAPLRRGESDAVFGSRMMEKGGAIAGGMPLYKFVYLYTSFQCNKQTLKLEAQL